MPSDVGRGAALIAAAAALACSPTARPGGVQESARIEATRYPNFGAWAVVQTSAPGAVSWRQVAGPPVLPPGEPYSAPRLQFRTALPPRSSGRFGPRALSPQEIPHYSFELARGGAVLGKVDLAVARSQADWPRAVVGEDRYIDCGDESARVQWFFQSKPPHSDARIEPMHGCVAHFRPDVHGRYQIRELQSGRQFDVFAGPPRGDESCARESCHPQLVTTVRQTAHSGLCAGCHSTATFYTSYDDSVCTTCHTESSMILSRSKEAEEPTALACLGCHTAQGFVSTVRAGLVWLRPPRPEVRDARLGHAHACASCHEPHAGGLRAGGCAACHASELAQSEGAERASCDGCHDPHTLLPSPSLLPCTRAAQFLAEVPSTPAAERPGGRARAGRAGLRPSTGRDRR